MQTNEPAPLILCTPREPRREDLIGAFADAGFDLEFQEPNAVDFATRAPQAILVHGDAAAVICRQLRAQTGDRFTPIIVLARVDSPGRILDAGADVVVDASINAADLLAQIRVLLRAKDRHDRLSARAAEADRVNGRLQTAYQQINNELDLARRIQESFLPQSMPSLPQVRFAVEYRPCGRVGGDFYDVFRLDENHYGFYVADAMGHGVGASLLTIFVKKGVRAKDIAGQTYRLVPPDEVLTRLNRDFIDQALSDAPFITMAYGLFNFRDGILQFSRAGHPYPLYVPKDGPIQPWQMEGSLLGVFDTKYHLRAQQLQPGDKVLLHTDGMDHAGFADHPVGMPSLLAAVEAFRDLPIEQLVQRLAIDLFHSTQQNDDLTVMGMEIPSP